MGDKRTSRRSSKTDANDPITGIRQNEIPQCGDVLWFDLAKC
jgi:hypothetical protein